MALRVVTDPNILVEFRGILVEVKERFGATVEDASLPLDETRYAAELVEKRLELIECV